MTIKVTPAFSEMPERTETQEETPLPYYLRPNKLQRAMNDKMVELVPELDSKWARTPMANNRWLNPEETTDAGEPCFIPCDHRDGRIAVEGISAEPKIAIVDGMPKQIIPNYIWMPQRKNLPAGYYHLATQESYIEVNRRFRKARPGLFQATKEEKELYRVTKNVIENRLTVDIPDDVHAQRMKALGLASSGGRLAAFGKAAYLPTLSSALISLGP